MNMKLKMLNFPMKKMTNSSDHFINIKSIKFIVVSILSELFLKIVHFSVISKYLISCCILFYIQ